ncbi:MAG: hypothetical protein WBN75_03710 [Verrucomicrobiia bacterium]
MAKNKDTDRPEWRDIAAVFVLRVTDSGLTPWALVACFLLANAWLITRNLDSKDTVAVISKIGTAHGLAWIGWLVAFIEIPIAKWAINRARSGQRERMRQLQDDNEKARELLKKLKQSELTLESQTR